MAAALKIPGIGPTLAANLAARGITTKKQLKEIVDELPKESQMYLKYPINRKIPLEVAADIMKEMKRRLVYAQTKRPQVYIVGSARRKAPRSKDVDILLVVPDTTPITGVLSSITLSPAKGGDHLAIAGVYASGARRRSLVVNRLGAEYYAVDLFLATQSEKPFALFHLTNGRQYNIRIRAYAKKRGLVLNQYGIFSKTTKKRAPGSSEIRTEKDITKYLGVTYHTPSERTDA